LPGGAANTSSLRLDFLKSEANLGKLGPHWRSAGNSGDPGNLMVAEKIRAALARRPDEAMKLPYYLNRDRTVCGAWLAIARA
jgi:hypothetical protein